MSHFTVATIQPNTFPSFSSSNSILNSTISSNSNKITTLPFNKSHQSWNRLKHHSLHRNTPNLAHKWMQYQGLNSWEGLLDPLDHNLRCEILRYGLFVEAAYRAFDFDVNSPTYATCCYSNDALFRESGMKIHGHNYQVTKYLHATCGIQLPKWVHEMTGLPCVKSSWIGYVAVCVDENEISRLGRRDMVISLRGTGTCLEWLENLRATLVTLPNKIGGGNSNNDGCMVQNGFLSLYMSKTDMCHSLQEMVKEEIGRLIEFYGDEPLSLTITGHSVGAALAILSAYDITTCFKNAPLVTVLSFGGPRVGNTKFRNRLEQSGSKILRIVNSEDVITKLPGLFVDNSGDVECNGGVHVDWLQNLFQRCVEATSLVYADVGQELRLSSRKLSYMKNIDVATCHDLKTYLHLVDCFVSSSWKEKTREDSVENQSKEIWRTCFGLVGFLVLFVFYTFTSSHFSEWFYETNNVINGLEHNSFIISSLF